MGCRALLVDIHKVGVRRSPLSKGKMGAMEAESSPQLLCQH